MKIRVFLGVLAVVMALTFSAVVFAADPVTITIWDFKYGDATSGVQATMQQVDALIMEQNPNIKIEHVAQPHDNYYQLVRTAVQSGEGPDVVMFHGGNSAYEFDEFTLSLNDYIAPWRSEIAEFSWAFCSEGGDGTKSVHMVPITVQGIGIYYNKALFKQAGLDPETPPSDIDAFMKACEALKKAGIVPITAGAQGEPFTIDFLFRALIANIYGAETPKLQTGEQTFANNAGFKRAVEIVQELVKNGYIDPNQSSIPYFMDAANMFAAGKGAMFVGLTSDVCHWKVFSDGLGKENVGYFPSINFPEAANKDQQAGQPAGIGYSVMAWSKHPAEAMKVIEGYARGEGAAIWMSQTGALAPNKNVDINKLGYPLVSKILERTSVLDFVKLLAQEEEQNFRRYCTQLYIAEEITQDKFIESIQKAMDNSKK